MVNLSSTLMTEWTEVAAIARCMPRLRRLELSDNQLQIPPAPSSIADSLSVIRAVYLNRTGIAWDQIVCMSEMLPSLEELHLCQNNITALHSASSPRENPVNGFANLRLLNLEINSLSDYSEVWRLRSLPKLEKLILNDNRLPAVQSAVSDDPSLTLFPALTSISINNNAVSQWSSIDNLSTYTQLTELRLKGNPVFEGETVADHRQLTIARIAQLQSLHGSPIGDKERQFAEQFYTKRYFTDFTRHGGKADSPDSVDASFTTQHRSYCSLLAKHGAPLVDGPAPKSQMLSLQIQFPEEPDKQGRTVSLPNSIPLQALKAMIRRLFHVQATRLSLSYIRNAEDAEREMDEDQRPLSYFAVASGNIVLARIG